MTLPWNVQTVGRVKVWNASCIFAKLEIRRVTAASQWKPKSLVLWGNLDGGAVILRAVIRCKWLQIRFHGKDDISLTAVSVMFRVYGNVKALCHLLLWSLLGFDIERSRRRISLFSSFSEHWINSLLLCLFCFFSSGSLGHSVWNCWCRYSCAEMPHWGYSCSNASAPGIICLQALSTWFRPSGRFFPVRVPLSNTSSTGCKANYMPL